MMDEMRPVNYPKLKDYKPSRFMLPTSHYEKKKGDKAVNFIEQLCHTKSKWAGKRFWLLPWQEQIVRDVFGIVKADGTRQFRTAFVEIPKKNGKSELAAAIALYLLYADGEASPEVYGAASDRQQASIVFDVAKRMVEQNKTLLKRSKIMTAQKRLVNYPLAGYYQVLSAEVNTKHGLNVSGLVFDELHSLPTRALYDVLTKGASDARQNPLSFIITTAGTDRNSIGFEVHTKAKDILEGRRVDPTFYPVIYGIGDDDDWSDESNWYKANPSLDITIPVDRMRDAFRDAKANPAEENLFRQLRLDQWVASTVRWIPEHIYDQGSEPIDLKSLEGRDCYGGLDLSSSEDITAFVLVFPPRTPDEKYIILPFMWVPEDTIPQRVRRASVPYDVWVKQGYMLATEGNVIDYGFIEHFIDEMGKKYHIKEIAFDRWGAVEMVQHLEGEEFAVIPFGQGFKDMSPATKAFYELLMKGEIIHGGHPVLRWMAGNVVVETDPAGNIKPTKRKSPEKIDGIVAAIMALDRCIRHEEQGSVYDTRDMFIL
ncbi:MAG: terminase large subunit [Lachnospiraceae bacterium]|nr:terminase large subunit [Lachnospiraceae bacterium]